MAQKANWNEFGIEFLFYTDHDDDLSLGGERICVCRLFNKTFAYANVHKSISQTNATERNSLICADDEAA